MCEPPNLALRISQAGCPKYETVCEPHEPWCCGIVDNRPPIKKQVELPKKSIIYPLLEQNGAGEYVFALDDKLRNLGFGRLQGMVIYIRTDEIGGTYYEDTNMVFDIDYPETTARLGGVTVVQGNGMGDC